MGVKYALVYLCYANKILNSSLVTTEHCNGTGLRNYSTAPCIRINWDGDSSWYAENTDNWIFSLKIGHIASLKSGFYYLQYVPASKPSDHAWFEVLEARILYCTWSEKRQFQGKLVVQISRQFYPNSPRPDTWSSTVIRTEGPFTPK